MNAQLRLGIAGLGTVGAALVNLLDQQRDMLTERCGRETMVTAVCARDKSRDRGCKLDGMAWHDDPVALAVSDEIDVFVELIGGEDGPARDAVVAALEAGKHVVTANKALLAKHGVKLASIAEEKGVLLNYEAAVAGAIPIIKVMRESLTSNHVKRISGIMNGTCNYILTRMEREGISFEACLADAQKLGYAEADPTFDIEGNDTAHKLAILTSLAFGTEISADDIYLEGITKITPEDIKAASGLGYRIKLLGIAQKTESGIEQRVHPAMVPVKSSLAQIGGVTNAVAIEADMAGEIVMSGAGAGGEATASAVSGDIADIAKSRPGFQHGPALGRPAAKLDPYTRARMRAHEGGYYIRLTVHDKPGVVASIGSRMAEEQISLGKVIQNSDHGDEVGNGTDRPQQVILVTHKTSESAIRSALTKIDSDGYIAAPSQMIRIEK